MNNEYDIAKYLNKLIFALKDHKDFDKDDFQNILNIIYQENISNNQNILINSLINVLLFNYINHIEIFEDNYTDNLLSKHYMPYVFNNKEDNLINMINSNRLKLFKERAGYVE